MAGGKKNSHTVIANVKEFSKNALSTTNRAIKTTISTYSPFISASLMNASTAAFDVSRFVKENNPLMRNKNKDPYVRRAINRASDAFQTSLNELRQGHLSFEETRNEISDYINENTESEWDSMAASAGGEAGEAGGGPQKQFSASDYVKGVAASAKSSVRALQVTTNKITESQYKSLNLATSKIVSANMANMQAITRQFSVTNSRIENVNANLVNLVQFNNETIGGYIQTATQHMGKVESFMEEMLAYSRLENEKRLNDGTGSKYRSRREEEDSKDFLAYGFDPGKYAKSIIDNLMETAFGPTILGGVASGIKGIFGKVPKMLEEYASGSLAEIIQQINPLQLIVDKFMPSLKGFSSVDDVIQKTITSIFTQLGSGTYDGPFSEIFRIFGIKGSTANIDRGDYNHDEAPWTGEDSRALKQVIPEYLSTIELKMANMVDQSIINTNATIDAIRGVQATILMTSTKRYDRNNVPVINGVGRTATNNRRIYDYDAGDFTSENKIIDKLRNTLQRTTSMYYDDSKDIIKGILRYADSDKMKSADNRKALSDALTAIFMNFNATTGETALTPQEVATLYSALQGLGVNTESRDVKTMLGNFISTTQQKRLNVNKDVGQEFQVMRNLGLGASTNDITTDIVNHNQEVIKSYQAIFSLETILRTLDDDLDNFQDFKRTDEYKNMDKDTKKAYDQMARNRDNAYARQGLMSALLDTSRLQNNPFNVVASTVVDTAYATASSLQNVVTGVSSFSEEIRNITDTIRDAVRSIRSILPGSNIDGMEQHASGATDIEQDKVVKVHKGEIILDPKLSNRVRNGIVNFINGDMDESKFSKKFGSKLSSEDIGDIKLVQKAVSSVGKIKIKDLTDVTDQIWDAGKYIESADSPATRIELLLQQLAYNQRLSLYADNMNALREAGSDDDALAADEKDRKRQAFRRGIGKLNKDGLYEGGVLSDFANSVKGTYDKVVNSLVGKSYNTYEEGEDGQKKLVHHEANDRSFVTRYKEWLVGRAETAADALGIKGEHKENISKTVEFLGENGHKLILGGIAGMAANCFLPIAVGPLIGVSGALIASSKTLNERMFGTKNANGGRNDDGLISTKVTGFIKDNIFSLISGGLLGAKIMRTGAVSKVLGNAAIKATNGLSSLITAASLPGTGLISQFMTSAVGIAFGPVGGALLGMGVAALSQSEHVKKFLFGEKDDATGKRVGGIIGATKKAFTDLGSALKEKIFGKDVQYTDADGNIVHRKDGSGILNRLESSIYAHLLRPIATSSKYIGKYFLDWFKDDVLNASERIVYPVMAGVEKLAKDINEGLDNVLISFAHTVKKAFEPVTKAITGIGSKVASATLKGVETVIKLSLKSVSAPLNIAAALIGKTGLGKPGLGAKLFMGDGRGKINRMMFGENVRLFFDELGNTRNQKVRKDTLKEKLEKYLDRNEKLFSKFKTISDFFKALGNTPFGASIKAVFNTLTHPLSVVLSGIVDGVMKGIKDLVTAPFKLLSLPFKGIKWVGNKLIGKAKDSYLGQAVSHFKERMGVIKSGGSANGSKNELTKSFARTYRSLNKDVTRRAEDDGLITSGVRGAVDALREHKALKNEKKNLEKQHKRDRALDKYISKLNLKMSPADFDKLNANDRNNIIANLMRKSGNRDIRNWDDEKIRALVTGGRSRVEKLDAAKQNQETATNNIANLPDTLEHNTTRITDKLQDIFDALTGKKKQNSEPASLPATNVPSLPGPTDQVQLPDVSASIDKAMDLVSIPNDAPRNKKNKIDTKQLAERRLSEIADSLGVNLDDISKEDKQSLVSNISKALSGKQKNRQKALDSVREKLTQIAQKAAQDKAAKDAQESVAEPTKTGINSRIKSFFDFDANRDLKRAKLGKDGGRHGKYNVSGENGLVEAEQKSIEKQNLFGKKKTKKYDTGNYNLTMAGKFKKFIRDRRDGTAKADQVPLNEDGTLNTDKLSGMQNMVANAMLGFGWRKKKSKGKIKQEQEQELTDKLKMLATGSGKVKIITTIIKKVLSGLVRGAVVLTGIGLFATKLFPLIKEPVKKLLFGDPDVEGDGLFGFMKGLWVNHVWPGIKNAFTAGWHWAFGDPKDPNDHGAISRAITYLGENLPGWIKTGLGIAGDLAKALFDAIVEGCTEVFVTKDPFNLIDKGKEEANEKAMNTVFNQDLNSSLTIMDEKTGKSKTYNIKNEDGTINESEFKNYMADSGYGVNSLAKQKNKDSQIRTLLGQQANWGIDKSQFTMIAYTPGGTWKDNDKKNQFKMLCSQMKNIDPNFDANSLYVVRFGNDPTDENAYNKDLSIYPATFESDKELCYISSIPKYVRSKSENGEYGEWMLNPEWGENVSYVAEGGSIGYGHFTQNDPRWARIGYGKSSIMANGGCGPTALANAINNTYGRNVTNPLTVARYSAKNGYNVDGGTSAGLFNRGAKAFGVSSHSIGKSGSSIANQLRHGNNVIVAGRGGSAYTSAGHIMSVRGLDGAGNAVVDDPMRRKSRHISLRNLTKGMTHAWSIGRGPDDVYYGNSPDGSNYAFMKSYYDSLGGSMKYYDTTTGGVNTANISNPKSLINDGSIIWGYNDNYDAACFVKSIASAVFNLYAKKKGLNNETATALIASLANSIAQPHTLQRSGSYGANTDGYVTDYSALANNVYAALSAAGGSSGNGSGISLTESRDLDPTAQKQLILGNLQSGKPVIIHTNGTTSTGLSSAYRSAVFGNWSKGGARDNHAVIIDGVVSSGDKNYALIGDPGSSQASRGQQSGAQIRFVDFDQLTNPLAAGKLNHLLTINDGGNIPMPTVSAPNPNAGTSSTNKYTTVSSSGASSSNVDDSSGITIGTDAATDDSSSKSKFSSFTEWVGGLVKQLAKVGSALLSAIFSGKSFKEVWAEMGYDESGTGGGNVGTHYDFGNTNVLYNPTTYMSQASDEYKAAYEMVMRNEHNTGTRGYINASNVKNGLKYVGYNSTKYERFMKSGSFSEDARIFNTTHLTSEFASELLGMALYYIKEHTPMAIDANFKRYCIVIANIFAGDTSLISRVYNDYKNSKLLFRDEDGIFMYIALCFEKLLLSDSDSEKCAKKFLNGIQTYLAYANDPNSVPKADVSTAKLDMKKSARNAALAVWNYMKENLLMMTYDDAKKIVSEQAAQQTAQVNGYDAASGAPLITTQYTGEWAPNANQQWITDPTFTKNSAAISQFIKPGTNYESASSGISNTYQPGYFRAGFSTMQQPDYTAYGRQLTRDLRTFPTITVDKMNQVIQSVAPNSPFVGHGQAFINAANMTGVDPLYIFSQTWESGFGTAGQSHLNKGNYHGLTAYERDFPNAFLNNDTASIDSGIMGGAEILSKYYINRNNPHQNNILSLCDADHCYNNETANYANTNASHLAAAEKAAGFGIGGDNAVNIHDAMMNTPTTDIYTKDDVYMGDADHPMNVKMDTTSTTSRLDVIIQLLSELLKGETKLPAATSKATESVAGYGSGKSSKNKLETPIIIANQNNTSQRPNSNAKSDGLRKVFDQVSRRALTYTH